MRAFGVISIFFVLCTVSATSSLFVNRAGSARKVQLFRKLYDNTRDVQDSPSATFEDKMSALVKSIPLLTLQSTVSAFVAVSAVSEVLSLTSETFRNQVRAKLCAASLASKCVDTIQNFDISEYQARNQYSMSEILARAKEEVTELVKSPLGMSTAFLAIMLLTGSSPGSITPFLIGELPSLLRFLVIVVSIAVPQSKSVSTSVTQVLFGTDGNGETTPVTGIDSLAENAAGIAEVFALAKVAIGLLSTNKDSSVRGFRDMIVLSMRLLLIQNFLFLRVRHLLRQNALSPVLAALKESTPWQYVLSLTNSVAGLPVLDTLRLLLDPATRVQTIRSVLGRHNIVPVLPDDVQVSNSQTNENDSSSSKNNAPSAATPKKSKKVAVSKKKKTSTNKRPQSGPPDSGGEA